MLIILIGPLKYRCSFFVCVKSYTEKKTVMLQYRAYYSSRGYIGACQFFIGLLCDKYVI